MKKKIFIAILILAVLVFILIFIRVNRNAATSVAAKKADIKIKASELIEHFEANEDSSNSIYLDKILMVSGTIDNISEDSTAVTVYLKQPGYLSGVICSFDKSEFKSHDLTPGDEVTIKGICSGYLLDVVLNKCIIVK